MKIRSTPAEEVQLAEIGARLEAIADRLDAMITWIDQRGSSTVGRHAAPDETARAA